MAECNSPHIYPNLNDQQQFTLNKMSEINDYFISGIGERELMSKRLSKYIASFDYFDKSLIVSSATGGSISTPSFATVFGVPVGIASASFGLASSISTGIVKKLLKTTQNKKKKAGKSAMLARNKLNSIGSKISEDLLNSEISHEEFTIIINEKETIVNLKKALQ